MNDGDENKEPSDFIAAYYIVDGGAPVKFGELFGNIAPQSFTATDVMGSTLQIVIEADVSFTNEFYFFDNVMVSGLPLDVTQYALTVNNGTGSGAYLSNTVVDIVAAAPVAGQEFDVWTGDVANVLDVTSSSTSITLSLIHI